MPEQDAFLLEHSSVGREWLVDGDAALEENI